MFATATPSRTIPLFGPPRCAHPPVIEMEVEQDIDRVEREGEDPAGFREAEQQDQDPIAILPAGRPTLALPRLVVDGDEVALGNLPDLRAIKVENPT